MIKTSRALATVNSNVLRLPNPDMLINTIGLQEAKTSTEVLRYREALWEGYQTLGEQPLINLNLVTEIFQQIKDTNVGLRSPHAMVVIKRGDSELRPGVIYYATTG